MQKIILRRQIRIWITPLKNTWWVLNINGTKLPGELTVINQVSTALKIKNKL